MRLARWPLRRAFTIARGTRAHAETLIVELTDEAGNTGRGEAVPYPRLGEDPTSALADLEQARPRVEAGLAATDLPSVLRTRAARAALDCALWMLHARRVDRPVWQLAALPEPRPAITACTISLNTPERMAEETRQRAGHPLLKLKLDAGDGQDAARLAAVRAAAPGTRLIVDANEGWSEKELPALLAACAETGVELVEQPLPEGADDLLARIPRPVPVCADESVRAADDLPALRERYDAVNVKLDKAGGLTPAIVLTRAARAAGLRVMVGCMLASSLAMAPAFLLAPLADWLDLDGPLLLAEDFSPAITYEGALMRPPPPVLWG